MKSSSEKTNQRLISELKSVKKGKILSLKITRLFIENFLYLNLNLINLKLFVIPCCYYFCFILKVMWLSRFCSARRQSILSQDVQNMICGKMESQISRASGSLNNFLFCSVLVVFIRIFKDFLLLLSYKNWFELTP